MNSQMNDTLLELKNIQCQYQQQTVVDSFSLNIKQGGMVCLLGPSGCGKTTLLRAIAGFEPITQGEIILSGKTISKPGQSLPPEKRKLGMVFQDYALFPHMDIQNNVAFSLRNLSKVDKQKVASEMLELVGLEGLRARYPHELSGGQQQRVALARALANKPHILLMDEPFSNLDVELRERLGMEVKEILKDQGITGILVTHDQHEAFALADQIGVINQGKLQQWDSAFNLYHEPSNRFVANFIGQGVMVKGITLNPHTVETSFGPIQGDRAYNLPEQTPVEMLLRPDDVVCNPNGQLTAEVVQKAFRGAETLYTIKLQNGQKLLSLFPSHFDHHIGEMVRVDIDIHHMVLFS